MEDFVPFLLAKKLKEKGFKCFCSHYYRTKCKDLFMVFPCEDWSDIKERINAPTISQVLKWLRSEKKLHVSIEYGYEEIPVWDFEIRLIGNYGRWWTDETYSSYELAAIAGIEYVIDNLI